MLINKEMQAAYDPERLCVSFEPAEILYLLLIKRIGKLPAPIFYSVQILSEPVAYCFLSEMPERRIPDIMQKSCALEH